jgi:hypothetical protein
MVLSDSYSLMEAELEPEAVRGIEEQARRGNRNPTHTTVGGVVGIKGFDVFLVLRDDGSIRIQARVRYLVIAGSEGSQAFGTPKPLETRDSTRKLFKEWIKIVKPSSTKSQNKAGTKTPNINEGYVREHPEEPDENSKASKRTRGPRVLQEPVFNAWMVRTGIF